MITIGREEGTEFNSGLTLFCAGGLGRPYLGITWTRVLAGRLQKSWYLRIRFRRWPILLFESFEYDIIENFKKNLEFKGFKILTHEQWADLTDKPGCYDVERLKREVEGGVPLAL